MRALLTMLMISLALPALAQSATIDGLTVQMDEIGAGFERPVDLAVLPDGRLLVTEKTGKLRFLEDGAPGPIFLDISDKVSDGNEQGLLGLALAPDFAETGRFYVNYTDVDGDTQIVAYDSAEGAADPQSARTVLSVDQPRANHNGGWIAFGPDGLLYIGMGDGGGAGDTEGNGQNKDVLLGKMLRIDPMGEPYGIPPGNPFAEKGGRPEIFMLGLRNPWRNTFDEGQLYVADVGQNQWEEVHVLDLAGAAGANLGWRTMEGRECYPPDSMCVQGGFDMPVHVYDHDRGCSITGGIVYRGAALPALAGRYFFADWCSGLLESFRHADGEARDLVALEGLGSIGQINSFARDADGEMLMLLDDGRILRLAAAR
jgi:glucose/arabinose dehydrogenase